MYFCCSVIISPRKKGGTLHLNEHESPSSKDALWQVWLKLAQWFLRRRFLYFVNMFPLFFDYLPSEEGRDPSFKKPESPSPKDALCHVWLKLAQWFLRRRYLNFVNVFSLFRNNFPLKRAGSSFEQILIPFTQECVVPSLIEISPMVLQKEIVNVFLLFRDYLLLEKGRGPSFKQTCIQSPKDVLVKFSWNWPSRSWEEKF